MANSESMPLQTGRPLRVLCCSGSLQGGGSERRIWQLASRLDRALFMPTVYLLYNRGTFRQRLPSDVTVESFWDEFDEKERYWPGQIHRHQVAHLVKVIQQHEIDVVFDHTFHMTLITGPAARRAGLPRVSVIVSPPSSDFQRSRERFKFLKKRMLAAAYRQQGCLTLAVSEDTARDAVRFYHLQPENVRAVPNPIDITAVRLAAGSASRPFETANQLKIVVVGRLSQEKGQAIALNALQLAQRDDISIDIIGDGPDRSQLQEQSRQLGIEKRVHFHGFLENPYSYIKAAQILCIPSHYEGLPNVALEAMALGTGIVATNCCGSLRKLIGDNERGMLVPVGDAARMSEAFIERITNPSAWRTRTAAAMQWVEDHHAFAPWLDQMQHILQETASLRR